MGVKVEEEWRYKKTRSQTASRSAFAFKINRQIKEKGQSKMSYGYGNITPYTKEVILKITGGARSKQGIKNGIKYISKDWQEGILDCNGIKYKTKEEIADAMSILEGNVAASVKANPIAEKLTHNLVFSASTVAGVAKEDMLQATVKTLKEKYPNNYFVCAYHDDTEKPHVHAVLNIHKDNGKKIDIKNKDFHEIRREFCHRLVEQGYDLKASRRYEGKNYNLEQKDYEELKRDNRNVYQVVEFGSESYKIDKNNNKNNYLIYKTSNDKEVTIWGKELLNEIINNKVKKGDFIKLRKTGYINAKVPVLSQDGETVITWKQAKRNQWRIEKAANMTDNKLELGHDIKIEQGILKNNKEIKLDSPEQRLKQLEQRKKFEHEKKLTLEPEYRKEFEIKQQREQKIKYKRKFSW